METRTPDPLIKCQTNRYRLRWREAVRGPSAALALLASVGITEGAAAPEMTQRAKSARYPRQDEIGIMGHLPIKGQTVAGCSGFVVVAAGFSAGLRRNIQATPTLIAYSSTSGIASRNIEIMSGGVRAAETTKMATIA